MQAEPTADALFASLRDEAGAKFVQALEKSRAPAMLSSQLTAL